MKALVSSDNQLYASFYQLVGAGARRPEDTPVEKARLLADDLLFPYYREEMRFAALSLDGLGATSYGECSLVLKDGPIRERATVFEENSVYFCKRRDLGLNRSVPPGYRATWDERDQLAVAKLESVLQPETQPSDFARILLRPHVKPKEDDFIEVHIYGPLHRRNIERLVVRRPKKTDGPLLKEIARILKDPEVGGTVEISE
ncbi:MAG: hypothetical protein HY237_15300 [Acidobacteria bacterium]|nr:hypothetical protein [Acidobacteriota bacterium]